MNQRSSIPTLLSPERHRLSRRFALLFACLLITVTTAGGGAIVHRASGQVDELEQRALQAARANRFAFDREVAAAVARLEALASSSALHAGDLKRFHDRLLRVPKPAGAWFMLFRHDRMVLNTLLPYDAVSFPDVYGSVPDAARRFQLLADGRRFLVNPFVWAPLQHKFFSGVSIPVKGPDDAAYVLSTSIPEVFLSGVLQQTSRSSDGSVAILASGDGNVIASSDLDLAGVGVLLPESWRLPAARGTEGTYAASLHGEPWIVAYASSGDVPWTAMIMSRVSHVEDGRHRALVIVLLSAGMASLVGVLAVLWIVRRFERPFDTLHSYAVDASIARNEAETRYRVFWENTGDGLFVVRIGEPSGFELETCNPAYLTLARLSDTDIPGRSPWANVTHPGIPVLQELFTQCIGSGTPTRYDAVVDVRGDGRHWETSLAPVRDPATGEVAWLLGCVRDVTVSRRTKKVLRRLSGRILTIQDEERRRIARELHDSTGQALLGAKLAISQSLRKRPSSRVMSNECLEEANELITQAQDELRTLSYLLHPPLLDELGLPRALEEYISGFARRSGLEVTFSASAEMKDSRFSPELGIALFRVAQESLGNAKRHARCTGIEVGLHRVPNGSVERTLTDPVALVIKDNGRGIPAGCAGTDGLPAGELCAGVGIASMRERMRQVGGTLVISQQPDQGLEIRAIFDARLLIAGELAARTNGRLDGDIEQIPAASFAGRAAAIGDGDRRTPTLSGPYPPGSNGGATQPVSDETADVKDWMTKALRWTTSNTY